MVIKLLFKAFNFVHVCVYVCREEKTEQLMDSKHEVERLDQELQRLKQEVRTSNEQKCQICMLQPSV